MNFTVDGKYIISNSTDMLSLNIISTDDFELAYGVKDGELNPIYQKYKESPVVVYWRVGNDINVWPVGKGDPILLRDIKLGCNDKVTFSAKLQRILIWGPQRPFELWDVKEKKLLRSLTSSKDKHIQSVAFSMNDTAVVIEEEGGVASLFDAKDGIPLAQHISAASVYYYDPDLRRIHLWNSSGQVIRHVEGRSYFGWFMPTVSGADK